MFAVPVGVLGCGVLDGLGLVDWLQPAFADSVLGALVGAAFFGSVAAVALLVYQREALGWGDVKLLAMIGSFLGFHPAIFAILLPASLTSAVTGILATAWLRRRVYQPFGPALAAWALVYLLYGQVLLPAWLPGLRHLGAPDLKILLPGWI